MRPFLTPAATVLVGILALGACGSSSKHSARVTTTTHAPTTTTTAARPSTTTTDAAAASKHLTAADRAAVETALTGGADHAAANLAAGKKALGTERYRDGSEGAAAFDNPNSGASRFSAWRNQSPHPDSDVSYILSADRDADSHYNASNEPDQLPDWQDALLGAVSDLGRWAQTAAQWQINGATDADLATAAAKVDTDIADARRLEAAILAAS